MNLKEITRSRDYKYRGKIVNLRLDEAELPNGRRAAREVVEHVGGACVAALTNKNELLFVRQFRYPYGEVLLELPAGKLEPGEAPEEGIRRELLEETGAVGGGFHFLGRLYPTPGYCDEVLWMYATRIERQTSPRPDEDEFLEVETIPLENAVEMVMNQKLPDAKTQAAVLITDRLVQEGKL